MDPRLSLFQRLTGEQFNHLRIGDILLLKAGTEEYKILAKAAVIDQPGLTAVSVRFLEIFEQGEMRDEKAGETILAGPGELLIF